MYARLVLILGCWSLVSAANGQIVRSFAAPIEERRVAATQPDVVAQMLVSEGSRVKSGQVLAELDNRVLKQSLKIAELRAKSDSAIEAAQAAIKIKKRKYDKLRPLVQNGHANEVEVEVAEAEYQAAAAELRMVQEKKQEYALEVERIKAEIERRVIRSPIDGVVTEIHCQPGEFVASTERQLVTVVALHQLKVRFYLGLDTVSQLRSGDPVTVLFGRERKPVSARIGFISDVTDPDSGTTRVDVVIDNEDYKLRSGTYCVWTDTNRVDVLQRASQ